ncbi:MAG: class I SAM-dependent methyltransferase [Patescibacteria group bacterium]|nr:class I SAM-dependent methyltransferase [Patescibacteria group bacterium]
MKLIDAVKQKKKGRIRKLANYFGEYDLMFEKYKNRQLRLLEIGIQGGGSLYTWKEFFPQAKIIGIDIDESCKQYEGENVKIYIGSQEDGDFLKMVEKNEGPFDIVIDDGGHTMKQQIITFKTLFPLLKEGGIYVIEDLHTSYWYEFGGKRGRSYTAISLIKKIIDGIHLWAIQSPRASLFNKVKNKIKPLQIKPSFYDNIRGMYVADSIAFILKETIKKDEMIKL